MLSSLETGHDQLIKAVIPEALQEIKNKDRARKGEHDKGKRVIKI